MTSNLSEARQLEGEEGGGQTAGRVRPAAPRALGALQARKGSPRPPLPTLRANGRPRLGAAQSGFSSTPSFHR